MRQFLPLVLAFAIGCSMETPTSSASGERDNSNVAAALASSPPCPAGVHRISEDTVCIAAELAPSVVARLQAILRDTDTTLVITSPGGLPGPAVAIGDIVRKRGLKLVVRRLCLSGCAHFILMVAPELVIEPRSIVAFHQTNTLVERYFRAHSNSQSAGFFAEAATAEQAQYEDASIPKSFLFVPALLTGIRCIGDHSGKDPDLQPILTTFTFHIPPRSVIESYRRRPFVGDIPTTQEDVEIASQELAKVGINSHGPTFIFGWPSTVPSEADVDAALAKIPSCP